MQRIGAALAFTSLNMALQTSVGNPYDTAYRAAMSLARRAAMDHPRTGTNVTPPVSSPAAAGLETTIDLVHQARGGDAEALNRLFARCLPALRRWASGRLPRWNRDLLDTDDLVQETVIRTVKHIGTFEVRHDGALQAYLRQAVMNRIRDEIRRSGRAPASTELDENQPDSGVSPLDVAIGIEAVARYESALARLRPEEREAIVAKIEMDGTYQSVALALGKRSPDAARMAVSRALLRLAEEMSRGV